MAKTPNSGVSFLPDMSEGQAMLLGSLLNLGGGIAQGVGQGKASDKDRAQQLRMQREQNVANIGTDAARAQMQMSMLDQNNQLTRDQQGVNASQLDPLAQQKSRAAFSLMGDKMNQWAPTTANFDPTTGMGSFSGGYNSMRPSDHTRAMYSPEAAASAEMQDFRMPLAQMNPNLPIPDLTQIGLPNTKAYNAADLFRKGVFDQQEMGKRTERDAVQRAFQSVSDSQQGLIDQDAAKEAEHKKSGGFWKKLGKIGLIAGGALATPFVGPVGAALIGAGVGAGTGAMDGGLKGALTGAALGGVTGGIGGGAGSAVKGTLGQVAKQTFTNPSTLLRMGGAATGGKAGAAMNLAGSLVPGLNHPLAGVPKPGPTFGQTNFANTYAQGPEFQSPFNTPPVDPVEAQFAKFGKKVRFNNG